MRGASIEAATPSEHHRARRPAPRGVLSTDARVCARVRAPQFSELLPNPRSEVEETGRPDARKASGLNAHGQTQRRMVGGERGGARAVSKGRPALDVSLVTGAARLGSSSWTSPAWAGRFYPLGTHDRDRLSYYAKFYDTVEVDSTYYRDPGPSLFRRWASVTPSGFVFAVKFPRDLLDPKSEIERVLVDRFLGNALELGEKMGAGPPSVSSVG